MGKHLTASVLASILCLLPAHAQQPPETKLDSSVVSAARNTLMMHPYNGLRSSVKSSLMKRAPSLLGNSDPLRFIRTLPGVSTGSELDAGIHVQGTEHQHTLVSTEGIPVYGAGHLLGLFSVFIPSHFTSLYYDPECPDALRLGGVVDMKQSKDIPSGTDGEISTGLLSTQGTVNLPTGEKTMLRLSLRQSYINALYSSFLQLDDNCFSYDFSDANLSFIYNPGKSDKIWTDLYFGRDVLGYGSTENGMDVDMKWHNALAAVHWEHDGDGARFKQSIYYTGYGLGMNVRHDFFDIRMPSSIFTTGYKASCSLRGWNGGVDLAYHSVRPQQVTASGGGVDRESAEERYGAIEATLRLSRDIAFTPVFTLRPEIRAGYYGCDGHSYPFLLPRLESVFDFGRGGIFTLNLGMKRQHLLLTGLGNMAFPYEFWLPAGPYSRPQTSLYSHLSYDRSFPQSGYSLTAEVYYRRLLDQIEYKGSILDYVREDYALRSSLLHGNGHNYGCSVMLSKQSGSLTGWAGYTLSRSLRSFDDPLYPSVYPSSHERIHEFNLVAIWSARKWDAGGSFVAASGTPFTAVESLYLAQNQLMCNFSDHNSARMRPYIRLDLSFNWYFHRNEKGENGINFSLYNATGRNNDIFYRLNLTEDRRFTYRSIYYKIAFLPSLSYFHKF